MRAWSFILIGVMACGGDDPGGAADAAVDGAPLVDAAAGSCGTNGSASVTGSVGGATIAPVVRAYRVTIPGAGTAIVLDEAAGTCADVGRTGEHLVLGFCDVPTARTYTVVGEQAFACPGVNAFGLVEQNGSMDFAESVDGTITIADTSTTCVTGSFAMSLRAAAGDGDPEALSGTFAAVICP